jgi:hypothetical protein
MKYIQKEWHMATKPFKVSALSETKRLFRLFQLKQFDREHILVFFRKLRLG